MKKSVWIGVGVVLVLIVIISYFVLLDNEEGDGDIDSGYQEWLNRDCPFGKLTVGCIPEPPPISLTNRGSYSSFYNLNEYSFLSEYVNTQNTDYVENFDIKEVLFEGTGHNVTYTIMIKLDFLGNDFWVQTGLRRPGTLAGHFMDWDERGFYPNEGDIVNVNITYLNGEFAGNNYYIKVSSI